VFHRLFTGKSQAYPQYDKTLNVLSDAIRALSERVRALEVSVKTNSEDIDHVDLAIQKLRGRVTGGIRYQNSQSGGDVPHGDKAALRRALGISPGQPFKHGS